jgi:hypothetical protein
MNEKPTAYERKLNSDELKKHLGKLQKLALESLPAKSDVFAVFGWTGLVRKQIDQLMETEGNIDKLDQPISFPGALFSSQAEKIIRDSFGQTVLIDSIHPYNSTYSWDTYYRTAY